MKIHLDLNENSYDIIVDRGILKNAGEHLNLDRRVLVVTDSGVPEIYAQTLAEQCKNAIVCTVETGEASKSMESFENLLSEALDAECSLEVVQSVHDQICQQIALHKESKVPEALTVTKDDLADLLEGCGVSEEKVSKFSVEFEQTFGLDAEVYPANIMDPKKIEIKTPEVSIKVATDRSDLIETRVIGGVKYILIRADESVEVNGVNIHIGQPEAATV